MTFYVENEREERFPFDLEKTVRTVCLAVLEEERCPYEVQVTVVVTDNEDICRLNREARGIDSATDVLSFPNVDFEQEGVFRIDEDKEADYFDPESGELVLGDIVISAEKVREQAESYGHSQQREFAFLVAHSMLHLCGYDHMEEIEAAVMEKKQEDILAGLGITRE